MSSTITQQDQIYMQRAITLAQHAEEIGEVPVGAIVVYQDEIIGEGWNQPISAIDPTGHAEIIALRHAAKTLENYRLPGTTIYVTLEPCVMCLGAMMHARIQRLVFGAYDPRTGAVGSVFRLLESGQWNHSIDYVGGVEQASCSRLLREFFLMRR